MNALVSYQICANDEALATLSAAEWFLPCMCELVPYEGALLRKTAVTAIVGAVIALSSMKTQVAGEVPVRPKRLAALLTPVRLLSRVSAQVLCENRPLNEPFATVMTDVRLLSRVNALVPLEVRHGGEALAALGAGERPLAGVEAQVCFQLGLVDETPFTLRAVMRLLTRVRSLVASEVGGTKGLAALGARTLARVGAAVVQPETGPRLEGLPAHGTGVFSGL